MAHSRRYWIILFLALFLLPETARDIHFIIHHLNDEVKNEFFAGITIVEDGETCPFLLNKALPRIKSELPRFSFQGLKPVTYLSVGNINRLLRGEIFHYRLRGPPSYEVFGYSLNM